MSKINLPPLPPMPTERYVGLKQFTNWDMQDYARAYAEQAVREALAAQEPVAWLYHDGAPGVVPNPRDMCTSVLVTMSRQPWCRNETPLAVIPEKDHGEPS